MSQWSVFTNVIVLRFSLFHIVEMLGYSRELESIFREKNYILSKQGLRVKTMTDAILGNFYDNLYNFFFGDSRKSCISIASIYIEMAHHYVQ